MFDREPRPANMSGSSLATARQGAAQIKPGGADVENPQW